MAVVGLGVVGIALPYADDAVSLVGSAMLQPRVGKNPRWLLNPQFWATDSRLAGYFQGTKVVASASMLVLLVITPLVGAPLWAAALQGGVLLVVATFLWRQPEP